MSHQLTAEEQMSELKSFFAKTWKIIVAVIVIGLLAFWGWRYWQSHQQEKVISSSEQYEKLVQKLDTNVPNSVDELVAFANNNDTIYAVFADLGAAQFYVETLKDYEGAKKLLTNALKKTDSQPVESIINIRIARLQYQLEQYQDSLTTLDKVIEQSWAPSVNDIRGDIFIKMSRYSDAVDSYKVALAASPSPDLESNIKIKLNQAEYLKAKQAYDEKQEQEKNRQENTQEASESVKKDVNKD
ncbi:tetratricopeptide repeat protein [Orbaceae bacterium ESL0721]|nr:tetratricopeptide repeat protein [Orbaceae bacterium ESL0721]